MGRKLGCLDGCRDAACGLRPVFLHLAQHALHTALGLTSSAAAAAVRRNNTNTSPEQEPDQTEKKRCRDASRDQRLAENGPQDQLQKVQSSPGALTSCRQALGRGRARGAAWAGRGPSPILNHQGPPGQSHGGSSGGRGIAAHRNDSPMTILQRISRQSPRRRLSVVSRDCRGSLLVRRRPILREAGSWASSRRPSSQVPVSRLATCNLQPATFRRCARGHTPVLVLPDHRGGPGMPLASQVSLAGLWSTQILGPRDPVRFGLFPLRAGWRSRRRRALSEAGGLGCHARRPMSP